MKVGLLPSDRSADEVMRLAESPARKSKMESRARRAIEKHKSSQYLMLCLALFGACIIINDGVLNHAISGSREFSFYIFSFTVAVCDNRLDDITHVSFRSSPVPVLSASKGVERSLIGISNSCKNS